MRLQTITTLILGTILTAEVRAQTTLNLGSGNNVSGSPAGAIGWNNGVLQGASLAVGNANTLQWGGSALVVGQYNYLQANSAIVGGIYNQALNWNSFTTGSNNVNSDQNSLVIGYQNITSSGLHHNGAIFGSFNSPVSKAAHLVIGNGGSAQQRSNSIIVYADGDILITRPQGNISMGIYQ